MISSVGPEAEPELISGALFYARETNAELGLAFITEFERALGVLCTYPRLGPVWRGRHEECPDFCVQRRVDESLGLRS